MEIQFNSVNYQDKNEVKFILQKKMDTDERVVRTALVRVWTHILEKYATPGTSIPPVEAVYRELLNVGVDAAVDAVVDEHWLVFPWMIRDNIQERVDSGLSRFDLVGFVEDVKVAQSDAGMLTHLREKISRYVMEEDF